MAKGKSPAFQCYPADLLNDEAVKLMDNREFGIYWKLICHNWTEKSIPSEPDKLATIVNEDIRDFETMWPKMKHKFRKKGLRLIHKRVERERVKQRIFSNKMRESANKLWNQKTAVNDKKTAIPSKPRHSLIDAKAMQGLHSSSSSSSSSSIKQHIGGTSPPDNYSAKKTEKPYPAIADMPPIRKLVSAWKQLNGFKYDDRDWDKLEYGRATKGLIPILEVFKGDHVKAIDCLQDIVEELKKKGMEFSLERAVTSRVSEWRKKHGYSTGN